MAEDSEGNSNTFKHYAIMNRRNKQHKTSDYCDEDSLNCAANFATLEIRVQTLEKNFDKMERWLRLLQNSLAKLHQIRQMVMAWAIAAGTIASFIYSNLTTIRDMFR